MDSTGIEEITIPFKSVRPKDLQGPYDYYEEVVDAYTGKYLEELGVQPTVKLQRYVARHAPLENCRIEAAWGEQVHGSAITEQLRIMQPRAVQPVVPQIVHGPELTLDKGVDALFFNRFCKENLDYVSTVEPEIEAAGLGSLLEIEERKLRAKKSSDADFRSRAMRDMLLEEAAAAKQNDMALTSELEQVRLQVRPTNRSDDEDKETETEQRDRFAKELARLKRQFILPFACDKRMVAPERCIRVVPWQHLQSNQSIQVHRDFHAEALERIVVTLDEIKHECEMFAPKLPLELLTHREDPALFVRVRSQLASSKAVRLTGLLSHLLYWVVFKHLHPDDQQLPEDSRQSLLVTVHDLWSTLMEPYRDFPMGVSLVIPAFCISLKQGMFRIFTSRYPSVFANNSDQIKSDELCEQLTDQINVLFMQLFDPDCVYARFGVLDSSKQAVRLWRKWDMALASQGQGPATRMITRKFRTTPAMNTLLGAECTGRPGHPKTRRLLAKSASDPSMRSTASKAATKGGAVGQNSLKKPQMDELKQEALFKVACKNLSRKGMEALPTGPGGNTAVRVMQRAASAGATRHVSAVMESRAASSNGRRRRSSIRALAGRGSSPAKERRPTTLELLQRAIKP